MVGTEALRRSECVGRCALAVPGLLWIIFDQSSFSTFSTRNIIGNGMVFLIFIELKFNSSLFDLERHKYR